MISRTFDYRRVKRLVSWQPIISEEFIYLVEASPKGDVGLWSFHKHLDGLMIHADMTLYCRGQRAIESAVNAFKWIFENTKNKIIYAEIDFETRDACYVAVQSGMRYTHSDDNNRFYEVRS